MSFLPPENQAVSNLLAVIVDPDKTKKRLAELTKLQEEVNNTLEINRKALVEAENRKKEADLSVAKAESLKEDLEKRLSVLIKKYEAQTAELDSFKDQFNRDTEKTKANLISEKQRQDSLQRELDVRETNVKNREKELEQLQNTADSLVKEYQDKLTRLKGILV